MTWHTASCACNYPVNWLRSIAQNSEGGQLDCLLLLLPSYSHYTVSEWYVATTSAAAAATANERINLRMQPNEESSKEESRTGKSSFAVQLYNIIIIISQTTRGILNPTGSPRLHCSEQGLKWSRRAGGRVPPTFKTIMTPFIIIVGEHKRVFSA